jgi:hypothetical protein
LDTPTLAPAMPAKKEGAGAPRIQVKTEAQSRLDLVVPKTVVDDMLPPEDKPSVARVLRISSPAPPKSPPPSSHTAKDVSFVGKDGLTKKQRQNQKKKERHREARAREEIARQEQLRAHQKELETIRLNDQIKKAERKSVQTSVWPQAGSPSLSDSVYTVRDLSDENLGTIGSDGAGSDGWQEVTSKGAKRGAFPRTVEKTGSFTDRSDEVSSKDDSEDGNILQRTES